jgi:VanZ family protein
MQSLLALLASDTRYRKLECHAAFLIYLLVLISGSIPGARAEVGEVAPGAVLHLLTYGVIALLLFRGSEGNAWSKACKAVLIVAAMGALDEYVQSFFPYRTASLMDWLVDVNAALFTSAAMWSIWPKEAGRKQERLR